MKALTHTLTSRIQEGEILLFFINLDTKKEDTIYRLVPSA